ncbi:Adenylate cyclase [Cytospora mali]|uniref:Adenylate cyclase n=1 Tax=Cytospora mali TaxID=578113 RepID=A0A194VDJ5_CYTMA|nr:Adenylate cyclase [Valsa mali var. pyri (nom. inval.)]
MTSDERSRISPATRASNESNASEITVKPLPAVPRARAKAKAKDKDKSGRRSSSSSSKGPRNVTSRLKADENGNMAIDSKEAESQHQISPTSKTPNALVRSPLSTTSSSNAAHRMSDLANYRRDLAVLEPSGSRAPQIVHHPPSTASSFMQQVAPWMLGGGSNGSNNPSVSPPANGGAMAGAAPLCNDDSDNPSSASQMSPAYRPASVSASRPTQNRPGSESPPAESAYYNYNDERRPSIASVTTTASSQTSKNSGTRGGLKKLQGFFGEEYPGRESSETSLPPSITGKETRSHSYSHSSRPHRDRNYSNATDQTRDASPSSSRPRTPVPAPEVDIARYGEAPVRGVLAGPDRERYVNDNGPQNPPKTSSSNRSGHSMAHGQGHSHRHNKSNDDPRTLRPTLSREDSQVSISTTLKGSANTMYGARSRAQSPTPSGHSSLGMKNGGLDGPGSPGHAHQRKGLFNRLRGKKEKEEAGPPLNKKLSASTQSLGSTLAPRPSRQEHTIDEGPLPYGERWSGVGPDPTGEAHRARPETARQATFNNKFPFSKKGRSHKQYDEAEDLIGPTERSNEKGTYFKLDTDLDDMSGIVTRHAPLTPMVPGVMTNSEAEQVQALTRNGVNGAWNAPDSWAVRKTEQDNSSHAAELEDMGSSPRPEEKLSPYCIRVFRSDGTFATLQMALDSSVHDLVLQIIKKSYVTESLDNYHIVLKKHDLVRVLNQVERPLLIQKRLLQQVGYEEQDRIEDLGREDNSYLCRFLFLSAKESDFHARTHDLGFGRMQKFNHIDLSGRNLITIPISLYSKASEIISLNLSRNLSLDLPRDFIHSCVNLRDIKYNNNEARKLPLSFSRANKLTYLDVSNNRLEQLEHAELSGLTGLLKLNLANNRLKHLPPYFGAYRALRTLNVSSNFLENFPSFLCDLESLVDLDMSFNLIIDFPENIGNLKNLERLVITNNRLSGALPDSFKNLLSLRELDVKYNAISAIDVISELPKLEIMTADHNAISQFIGSFERLRSLKLNANPITKFDVTSPSPTLKLLNLSNAQLASIDDAFHNILNLERLVLDRNYFVSLPPHIGNLRRLEHFSIAKNSIGELPPEIGCLQELRVLDVRGNNMRKLPMEIWWANKLETLNASSNVLESFPKPASRPPQAPSEPTSSVPSIGIKPSSAGGLSPSPSTDDLMPDGTRRPSQASSTLLSVGPSPVPGGPDRKSSVVSVYGKGGRKTSVMSRTTTNQSTASMQPPAPTSRKDSGVSTRLTQTFAGSLRNLYLADNELDDDIFDQITLLGELRLLNLSYNDLSDMPQRSIKSWPQLLELYLSGNELTTLPADDLEEYNSLQVLHINSNKFTNLPADISKAKKLAVLDCGSNYLKYNISNVPYDWNWNLNPNLRFLNLSGNRRLEIKQTLFGAASANREQYTDFSRLQNLRVLGLMDVTLIQPSIPDQSEDRRVRTSGSLAGFLPYGMADTLGRNEHLSTIDLVVPRFNSSDTETLLGLFDGQALSSGGSKIAKYLHENFGHIFSMELKALKPSRNETPVDALRRAFLSLNKDLVTVAIQHAEDRPLVTHRGSAQPVVLSKEDLNSGGVATVAYLHGQELYIANVGDVQAMLIRSDGSHKFLTCKHDPAEPSERSRIRDAGGWVSRNGRLNDLLEVSRAFGYVDLMPAVQAAPHVTHMTVKEQDEIIMLATKEIWEFLPPELVADFARGERHDLMRASQKLRDLAMAYGATGKIMVMMMSIADLKKRNERSRLHRGQSMSLYPSGLTDDLLPRETRKPKRAAKGDVLDSDLRRLEPEVPAPTGMVAIVFTDIKNSTSLWETYPAAMRSAIKAHNDVMRRQLRRIGGYEVKTEGDAFMVSFPTATSALLWCFSVQMQLLDAPWPQEILNSVSCQSLLDKDNNLIFRGLSVRMGTHWGEPLCEVDPITRRMDYYGPIVNKASRVSACADGGQITVSSDFISEIQRCLETYQEPVNNVEDSLEDDSFALSIRKELRSLSSQGFEVKEMGEKKLKGLENPEVVYSLYPHALAGRIEQHLVHERQLSGEPEKPATLTPGGELAFDPEVIWALWRVSLRLEMLCSTLEEGSNRGLQPPETELLERMKQKGGETCISTLTMRHLALGGGSITKIDDLRAPMSDVLSSLAEQLAELQQYKARFGELYDSSTMDEMSGSDTEQE